MKQKKSLTKRSLQTKIDDLEKTILFIADRLKRVEVVFDDFVEMTKQTEKFEKYLDGKYKQSEHKQS
tara:strand:+ start:1180 stop:1380 length:201 start_codon:yes stop_codon:yes gene_type:complete